MFGVRLSSQFLHFLHPINILLRNGDKCCVRNFNEGRTNIKYSNMNSSEVSLSNALFQKTLSLLQYLLGPQVSCSYLKECLRTSLDWLGGRRFTPQNRRKAILDWNAVRSADGGSSWHWENPHFCLSIRLSHWSRVREGISHFRIIREHQPKHLEVVGQIVSRYKKK